MRTEIRFTPYSSRSGTVTGVSVSTGVLRMKARESLVRLKEFQVREKQRQLGQLQMMMAEFERMLE